jgi:predicted metal-dependent peptidase
MAEIKKWEDYDTIVCPDGQEIDMQALLDDQERAKAALVHLCPFFGEFIGKLRPVYTFRIQTQATDGRDLLINPQFTYNLNFSQKVFVLAHEIMHCVLNHMRRAKDKGWSISNANIPADYECNITLAKEGSGLQIISMSTMKQIKAYVDKKYDGWGFEQIYNDCAGSYPDSQDNSMQGNDQVQQVADADYIKGWNQAIADWKAGKLKL